MGRLLGGPADGQELDVGEPPLREVYWQPPVHVDLAPTFSPILPPPPERYWLQRGWQHQTVAFYRYAG
jgi:hypothetical protein